MNVFECVNIKYIKRVNIKHKYSDIFHINGFHMYETQMCESRTHMYIDGSQLSLFVMVQSRTCRKKYHSVRERGET